MYHALRVAAAGESCAEVPVRELADSCESSEATARRVLRRLQELGAVDIQPQVIPATGERRPNLIRFPLERQAGAAGVLFPELEPAVTKPKKGRPAMHGIESPGFEAFWALWPKRVARKDAAKAWDQTVKDRPPQAELLAAVRAWVVYWEDRGDPSFVPHAATWLRGHRWGDEVPARGRGKRPEHLGPAPSPAVPQTEEDVAHAKRVARARTVDDYLSALADPKCEKQAREVIHRRLAQSFGCSVPPTDADLARLRTIAEGGEE